MGIQLINGMFDLSVAGVANMCGVIVGALMASGMHPGPAMVITFVIGACVGVVNGLLVTKLGTNAMVTTLGTWWACQGVSYGLTGGISFHRFPEGFQNLGQGRVLGQSRQPGGSFAVNSQNAAGGTAGQGGLNKLLPGGGQGW